MKRSALIITNLGTPDSTSTKDVRKYLFEFLNDRRVIDIPLIAQKILVNLIIVPFRAPKSAKLYEMLWTDKGSPLLYYSENLVAKLQKQLKDKDVYLAMRYGNPSIEDTLDKVSRKNYDKISIFPLYPQYASSTTGSTFQKFMDYIEKWEVIPEVELINQFYDNDSFIDLFVNRIKSHDPENYDHIIFSYHGLPIRHVNKTHPKVDYHDCNCPLKMTRHGKFCYRATCYETTRKIVEKLNLDEEKYTVAFQSRLDDKWLQPFSDKVLENLAKNGKKKILMTAPSFTADCLETNVEIGVEYEEIFKELGGEQLDMVKSLNDDDDWVNCIKEIVETYNN